MSFKGALPGVGCAWVALTFTTSWQVPEGDREFPLRKEQRAEGLNPKSSRFQTRESHY